MKLQEAPTHKQYMNYQTMKRSSLGRSKTLGPWKEIWVEFVDGHSRTMGKDTVKREGLKCMAAKKLIIPRKY